MANENNKGLDSLAVWKKGMELSLYLCDKVIPKFPETEKYALISQLRRSVQSIPANIAEGYGRYYFQEGVRFAYISRGSLEETYSHLVFAKGMKYLDEDNFSLLIEKISELKKMINGYISYLKKTKRGISEPGSNYEVSGY